MRAPTLSEAWWSLANLKTLRFSDADVLALREGLRRADLADEDRMHFEFAIGKALEDAASHEESFAHYAAGNALHRKAWRAHRSELTSSGSWILRSGPEKPPAQGFVPAVSR